MDQKMDEITKNRTKIALFYLFSEKFAFPYLEWPLYIISRKVGKISYRGGGMGQKTI